MSGFNPALDPKPVLVRWLEVFTGVAGGIVGTRIELLSHLHLGQLDDTGAVAWYNFVVRDLICQTIQFFRLMTAD